MLHLVLTLATALLAMGPAPAPQAKPTGSLLVQRIAQEKTMDLPTRGMTMAQVTRKFGAPERKLDPRGGDTKRHPVINRWEYAKYIVYFEHSHVIHTVLNTPAGNNRDPDATH